MSKNSGIFSRSLKVRVIALTVIVFVIISIIAFFAFRGVVSNVVEDIGKRFAEKQVLFDRSRSLQPLLREVALAKKLARSPTIKAWAKNEKDADLKKQGFRELESFREMFRDKSYFFVINQSGNYYFNDKDGSYKGREYRYTLSPNNPKDEWYYATVSANKECQLNVAPDRELNVTKVWINCLVKGDSGILGLIGTGIDLSEFIHTVVESKQIGVNTIFIDQSGSIQAHRNPRLIDFQSLTKKIQDRKTIFQLFDNPAEKKEFRLLLDSLLDGSDEVKTMFISIGGKRYLAGSAYLEEMGWFNISLMDLEAMVGRSHFIYFAGLMLGALLITLLLVTALLNHFVLNRIYRLENSVQMVSKGEYHTLMPDQGEDEIGRLSMKFKEMAKAISDQTENLEQQIQKRTKEFEGAKEKAIEATKLKDKFVTLVSHDLRSPLSAMIGLLDLIKDKTGGRLSPEEKDDVLNRVISSSKKLVKMIDTLLSISRLQTGKIETSKKPTNALALVVQNSNQFVRQAGEKGVKIINNIPESLVIDVDPELFGQVIQNLISNAIKFCNKSDEVTIFIPDGRTNVIAVKDTGIGVDDKILPDIFREDVKTMMPGTAGEEGTGLGLPYCRDILEAHGGSITVESEKGVGSIFYLELPK